MKTNIKQRTDRELYLLVYNTEELWKLRHSLELKTKIDELYEYTEKQLEILMEVIDSESED